MVRQGNAPPGDDRLHHDGHDARRGHGYSQAELRFIARLEEGWKTEMEGGGCLWWGSEPHGS
jgi:hypothetical protein